jgi:hypothetical protein
LNSRRAVLRPFAALLGLLLLASVAGAAPVTNDVERFGPPALECIVRNVPSARFVLFMNGVANAHRIRLHEVICVNGFDTTFTGMFLDRRGNVFCHFAGYLGSTGEVVTQSTCDFLPVGQR